MLGNQEQQHTKSWGKIPWVPLPCLCVFLSITPLGFNGESRLLLLLSELFPLETWEIAKVSAVGPALACTWPLVWYLWPKNHTIRSLVVASGCNWPLGIQATNGAMGRTSSLILPWLATGRESGETLMPILKFHTVTFPSDSREQTGNARALALWPEFSTD